MIIWYVCGPHAAEIWTKSYDQKYVQNFELFNRKAGLFKAFLTKFFAILEVVSAAETIVEC